MNTMELITEGDLVDITAQIAARVTDRLAEVVSRMQRAAGQAQTAMEEAKKTNAQLDGAIAEKRTELADLERRVKEKREAFHQLYGANA